MICFAIPIWLKIVADGVHLKHAFDHSNRREMTRSCTPNGGAHSIGVCKINFKSAMLILALLAVFVSSPAKAASIPTDGLIGYWTGNNTAADSSIVGNNGSFGGTYATGGPGGGASFDLSTGKVVIPNNAAYNFQSYSGWTVGFWFNTNGIPVTSTNETFLGQDNGPGFQPKWFIDYGYSVFGPTNDFVFHLNDFNQERLFLGSDSVTLPTGWNQLTVVVDTDTVDFYLNGQAIGSAGLPDYVLQTSAPLVFGATEPGLSYSGLMSDVTIYDRALSQAEVSELANPNAVPLPTSASMGLALLMGLGSFKFYRTRMRARTSRH